MKQSERRTRTHDDLGQYAHKRWHIWPNGVGGYYVARFRLLGDEVFLYDAPALTREHRELILMVAEEAQESHEIEKRCAPGLQGRA